MPKCCQSFQRKFFQQPDAGIEYSNAIKTVDIPDKSLNVKTNLPAAKLPLAITFPMSY